MEPIIRFRPLHDHVVVLRENPEKKIGSIIIPETHDKRAPIGVVLAVGPGLMREDGTREPMSVEVGQKVAFYAHIPMVLDSFCTREHQVELLRDRDIHAVYDGARRTRTVRMHCPDKENPPVYPAPKLESIVCHSHVIIEESSELVITYSYDVEEEARLDYADRDLRDPSVVFSAESVAEDRSDAC